MGNAKSEIKELEIIWSIYYHTFQISPELMFHIIPCEDVAKNVFTNIHKNRHRGQTKFFYYNCARIKEIFEKGTATPTSGSEILTKQVTLNIFSPYRTEQSPSGSHTLSFMIFLFLGRKTPYFKISGFR